MSVDSIRSLLRTKVAGVAGIAGVAPVYDYSRHVTTMEEIKLMLRGSSQERPHWWSVKPAQENPVTFHKRGFCTDGIYRWDITGFYALQDAAASEKAFITIVEAVCNALLADLNLGGNVRFNHPDLGLPGWVGNDYVMAAGLLLHRARITYACVSQVQG